MTAQIDRVVFKAHEKDQAAAVAKSIEGAKIVLHKKSGENALFKEIVDSQKAFAARAVKWDMDNNVGRRMAYNHYYGPKKPAAKKA